ncbi:elongation factor Tu [Dysgonomonas sp. GY617]|uniref:EF-Tu C-terminal domain-related protein n=1 Tax=Dysgonomonas sp. GY617 TaxID=2780420 RepID=UPI0018845AC8|nr:elongation factor Tu [Dysgonomonas sp. GY617]MBF0578009.1 elongation factor Tu [Dysgonomonas sp. GY617]
MNTNQLNRFTNPIPELRANIYYLLEKEGGRKTSVRNGYRGQFHYDGKDWNACQAFIDKEICLLGETVDCYLTTASPQFHIQKFYVGKEFEVREGTRIVGIGIITEILRPDFCLEQ